MKGERERGRKKRERGRGPERKTEEKVGWKIRESFMWEREQELRWVIVSVASG